MLFSLAALIKWASQTFSYPSLNESFKRRLILKLIVGISLFLLTAFFPHFLLEISWYISANIVLEILFGFFL